MNPDVIDTLTRVRHDAAANGYELIRAAPGGAGRLVMQLGRADGTEVAGQWYAEPARCTRAAVETAAIAHRGVVQQISPHLVVQARGADRRLPALHGLVRRDGVSLVAHRPERRGVVRHTTRRGRVYTKFVRPNLLPGLVDTLLAVTAISPVTTPDISDVDAAGGSVTMHELPGRTLHALLGDETCDETALVKGAEAVGRAVGDLHRADPLGFPRQHRACDEVRAVKGWIDQAATHGLLPLPEQTVPALLGRMERLLARPPSGSTVLHRDLHDKQLLLDNDRIGLLDLDLAAAGDPALDLANLLVHLEFRGHQGVVSSKRIRACVESILAEYRPDPAVRAALSGYGLATRLRLLGVYAFRPRSTAAAVRLITHPQFSETT